MAARAAALTEPAATALHALEPGDARAGPAVARSARLLVIGGGAIGLLAALLLRTLRLRAT